jgi:uncharacterized protein
MPEHIDHEREPERPVEVPFRELAPDTLQRVLEDLVTRDGTDYGAVEQTLEQKTQALRRRLESGEATLVLDLSTETLAVMAREQLLRLTRGQ